MWPSRQPAAFIRHKQPHIFLGLFPFFGRYHPEGSFATVLIDKSHLYNTKSLIYLGHSSTTAHRTMLDPSSDLSALAVL